MSAQGPLTLNLSHHVCMTAQEINERLAQAAYTRLDLSHQDLGRPESKINFVELMKELKLENIQELDLSYNAIGFQRANIPALHSLLIENPQITVVKLCGNRIFSLNTIMLAKAFHGTAVREVHLGEAPFPLSFGVTNFEDEEGEGLVNFIENLPGSVVQVVNVEHYKGELNAHHAQKIADAIAQPENPLKNIVFIKDQREYENPNAFLADAQALAFHVAKPVQRTLLNAFQQKNNPKRLRNEVVAISPKPEKKKRADLLKKLPR